MDFIVCSGSLSAELIARNIQDLQSLIMILSVRLFNRGILGRKAATGGSIDYHDHFTFVIHQIQLGISFFIFQGYARI